jgi:hypothetical protein
VIRPDPLVEVEGRPLGTIDGSPLFVGADAATAAVDLFVAEGLLVEEARDDHDVRTHYRDGAALIEAFARPKKRTLPGELVPVLRAVTGECVVRERCRLRRLRRAGA